MEDEIEKPISYEPAERDEVYSRSVRAGKRTYFFDVKATKSNEYYLTITESKKRANREGKYFYEKHKIFLYKEDFQRFAENLQDVIEFINTSAPEEVVNNGFDEVHNEEFVGVEFEDLDKN